LSVIAGTGASARRRLEEGLEFGRNVRPLPDQGRELLVGPRIGDQASKTEFGKQRAGIADDFHLDLRVAPIDQDIGTAIWRPGIASRWCRLFALAKLTRTSSVRELHFSRTGRATEMLSW
jgi:hypothetical protein